MSLPTKIEPLAVYRGDAAGMVLALWKDQERTDPADLTGAEVRAQIRSEPDSTQVTGEWEVAVADNLVTLSLLPKVSADLDPSNVYDVEVCWDPATRLQVQTVARGVLQVTGDVTR